MSVLDSIELFDSLSVQEKDTLALFCQDRDLLKWEELFAQWDEASAMYIVVSWKLWSYRTEEGKEKMLLWYNNVWELVGEMALFWERAARTATTVAEEDSKLITILYFSLKEIENKHPEILNKIKEVVLHRLEEIQGKVRI